MGFLSLFEGHKARILHIRSTIAHRHRLKMEISRSVLTLKRAITSNLFPGGVPQYLVAYLSGGHTAEGQLVHNVSLGVHSQLTLA